MFIISRSLMRRDTHTWRRLLVALTIVAAAFIVAGVLRVTHVWRYDGPESRIVPRPAPTTCAEDDPCWDCSSTGNHKCGGAQ